MVNKIEGKVYSYDISDTKEMEDKASHPSTISLKNEDLMLNKIRILMKLSPKIEFETIQELLDINERDFNKKIKIWANELNFVIKGNYLIVEKEGVEEFIRQLDRQFLIWSNQKKKD